VARRAAPDALDARPRPDRGRALEEAAEAEIDARGAGAGFTGRLRVSAAVTFARLHIVPRLPAFLADHPGLTMDVILDDRVIDLVEDGIDISLRMGELADSSLTARRLATGRRLVLGAPAYFERHGEPAAPAVVHTQGRATWSFQRKGAEVSVSVSGRLRLSAAEGVRAAVLAGMGLTIASEWMFSPELASGAVRPVLVDWTLPPIDLWALYPTGRMPSAKARAFAAFVEAEMARGL
jgi:DNA-binding transcriptional LysR family regulator